MRDFTNIKDLAYWLALFVISSGMIVVGMAQLWAGNTLATTLSWGVSFLGFFLAGLSIVYYLMNARMRSLNSFHSAKQPAFVLLAGFTICYAIFVTIWYSNDPEVGIRAFKRYFQAVGFLLFFSTFRLSEKDITRVINLFVMIALVQAPIAIYQLLVMVPLRESLKSLNSNMVPIDGVAGTFGATLLSGGANGEMAAFLILVLAFILSRHNEQCIKFKNLLLLLPIVLLPLFLGETKVVVIILPVMLLTLYRTKIIKAPVKALVGLLLGTIITLAAINFYFQLGGKEKEDTIRSTIEYNFGAKGYSEAQSLNRTTVLSFWYNQHFPKDIIGAVFGHGLGQAHEAKGGELASRYAGYGISLTAASSILWELGIVGMIFFICMLMLAWRSAEKVRNSNESPSWVKADATAIQASLPIFVIYLFYRSALIETLSFQIFFWTMLGYLAWMLKRHTTEA